jgi:hypothetical protein
VSRGAPAPQETELGWYVPTRTTTEPERYVLTSGTPEQVRRLRNTMALPGSCVKCVAGQFGIHRTEPAPAIPARGTVLAS